MENSYVEKIVTKKMDAKTTIIRILSVLFAVLVTYCSFVLFGTLTSAAYGLVVFFFVAWLVWYVFSVTYVEYEFILVKNELTIDAIYGKNKRKSLHTIDVSKCEAIAPAESDTAKYYAKNTSMTMFDYTSGEGKEPVYLLVIPHGAMTAKLYMEFDERMLEAVRFAAPGKVKMN